MYFKIKSANQLFFKMSFILNKKNLKKTKCEFERFIKKIMIILIPIIIDFIYDRNIIGRLNDEFVTPEVVYCLMKILMIVKNLR